MRLKIHGFSAIVRLVFNKFQEVLKVVRDVVDEVVAGVYR